MVGVRLNKGIDSVPKMASGAAFGVDELARHRRFLRLGRHRARWRRDPARRAGRRRDRRRLRRRRRLDHQREGNLPMWRRRLFASAAKASEGCLCATSERSADCLSQDCLVRPPPRAASCELAVYDDTRQAANSVLFCRRCDVRLMHVMNFDLVVRTCDPPDEVYGLVTCRATSGENLNFLSSTLRHVSLSVSKPGINPPGVQRARA